MWDSGLFLMHKMRRISLRFVSVLFLWMVLAAYHPAFADALVPLPASMQAQSSDLHLLGEGELTWFLFHVYDAALYVSGTQYNPKQPFALAIRYQRSFSSAELAKTSLREMIRLAHPDSKEREQWQMELQRAFPNVHAGDVLVGLYTPQSTAFYFNGKLFSRIENPSFGPAFFAIWLSPQTQVPGLRKKLLGEA